METGKKYFFTASILNWQNALELDEIRDLLLKEWKHRVALKQIKIDAFVIMPNHYHCIIQFIDPVVPSDIIRDIHKWFSKAFILKLKTNTLDLKLNHFIVNKPDRKFQIWQRNPLSVLLYDNNVLHQKLDYIHQNPLQDKWLLAKTPEEYKYSSANFYETGIDIFDLLSHIYD
jgi:putative transposase